MTVRCGDENIACRHAQWEGIVYSFCVTLLLA